VELVLINSAGLAFSATANVEEAKLSQLAHAAGLSSIPALQGERFVVPTDKAGEPEAALSFVLELISSAKGLRASRSTTQIDESEVYKRLVWSIANDLTPCFSNYSSASVGAVVGRMIVRKNWLETFSKDVSAASNGRTIVSEDKSYKGPSATGFALYCKLIRNEKVSTFSITGTGQPIWFYQPARSH